jgi:hypothetical protein
MDALTTRTNKTWRWLGAGQVTGSWCGGEAHVGAERHDFPTIEFNRLGHGALRGSDNLANKSLDMNLI